MSVIGWIVLGLIVGITAKLILPGRQAGGWILTLILGIVGALLGGWIGGKVAGVQMDEFWSLTTWFWAVIGAIIVMVVFGLLTRGSRSRNRA